MAARLTLAVVLAAVIAGAACGDDPASRDVPAAPSSPEARKPSAEPKKERPPVLKTGDPVPAFRWKDQAGKDRTLAEFRGKRVVLWFYPKADTGG